MDESQNMRAVRLHSVLNAISSSSKKHKLKPNISFINAIKITAQFRV